MKILVLTMGGTIDAESYPEGRTPQYITPGNRRLSISTLRDIAEKHGGGVEIICIPICNKDSKDMNDMDRDKLYNTVQGNAASYPRIIVSTGTDNMTDLAKNLKSRVGTTLACPVVFTGAISPLANQVSDGRENLELAAFGKPDAAPDIYIAMHGHFVTPNLIYKDFDKKKFVLR